MWGPGEGVGMCSADPLRVLLTDDKAWELNQLIITYTEFIPGWALFLSTRGGPKMARLLILLPDSLMVAFSSFFFGGGGGC